jgi:hypothetical protein
MTLGNQEGRRNCPKQALEMDKRFAEEDDNPGKEKS